MNAPILNPEQRAWDLYRSHFKDGEQIVLEDDQGAYVFGKLEKTTDTGILISRPLGRCRFLAWHEITFMAHDGFPVKEVMGMTYEQSVNLSEATDHQVIREAFDKLSQSGKKSPPQSTPVIYSDCSGRSRHRHIPRMTFGGGCPFVFEDVEILDLVNPGNNGPQFWGEDNEENLVMRSKDGAICHSFDLEHLFLFDGLTIPALSV